MKKKLSVFIMILCLLLCTTSCGSNSEAAKYQVYYLDMDETSITGVDYELQAGESNPTEMVDELLAAMKEAPEVTGQHCLTMWRCLTIRKMAIWLQSILTQPIMRWIRQRKCW